MDCPQLTDIINQPKKYNSLYCRAHFIDFYNCVNKIPGQKFVEKLWQYFYGAPKGCFVCGSPTKFVDFKTGYKKYCSCKCANNSLEVKENKKTSCIERFGVDNPMKCKKIANKLSKPQDPEITKKIIAAKKQYRIERNSKLTGYTQSGQWVCKCPHTDCGQCNSKTYVTTGQIERDRVRLGYETCTVLNPIGTHGPISAISKTFFNRLNELVPGSCEQQIGPYRVDWVYKNIVIEFNGDYWHANPAFYEPDWVHPVKKCPAQDIWMNDLKRIQYLMDLGYDVYVVWESDDYNSFINDIYLKINELTKK